MINHVLGRYQAALEFGRRSLELDPLSVQGYGLMGRVYSAMGLRPEAEEAFRKALEITPDASLLRALLAFVLAQQGRHEEALAEAEKEAAGWSSHFALAVVHAMAGRMEESSRALQALVAGNAHDAAYQIAVAHAVRGEVDSAFEWLERAYAQHDSGLVFSRGHAQFRALHGDPRWAAFLAKMRFPS
jgi:tetratricopeptide (TPR) repeat protein